MGRWWTLLRGSIMIRMISIINYDFIYTFCKLLTYNYLNILWLITLTMKNRGLIYHSCANLCQYTNRCLFSNA